MTRLSEGRFVADWTPFLLFEPLIDAIGFELMSTLQDLHLFSIRKVLHANTARVLLGLSTVPHARWNALDLLSIVASANCTRVLT